MTSVVIAGLGRIGVGNKGLAGEIPAQSFVRRYGRSRRSGGSSFSRCRTGASR